LEGIKIRLVTDIRVACAGRISIVAEFVGSGDWRLYEKKLDKYFLANGIEA